MRKISAKIQITIWLTILMMALFLLLSVFMVLVSGTVIMQTEISQLESTVHNNISQVELLNGKLQIGQDFQHYQNGVTTLIYSGSKALLSGQIPVAFTVEEPFSHGFTRAVSTDTTQYLVTDLWLPSGWENGIWLRSLIAVPDSGNVVRKLSKISLVSLPVFVCLASLGSYLIAKRAFSPLDSMIETAEAINEAKDLSGRIVLKSENEEFTRLADTFNGMFERLERSFETEKQFTSDASHELRTPVSVIQSACECSEKFDNTPEERLETIRMIRRQAEKMSALISQLLSITRMDQDTGLINPEDIDLGELVNAVCQECGYDMERLSVEIHSKAKVSGDPSLLSRLVRNLVDNGFKYGKPDGRVWVTVSETEKEVLLSVADDGIGIPDNQKEKIWQRFYQVDPARSSGRGTGLGLSMVQQIAKAHRGKMTMESVPDIGSKFTLHLPKKNFGNFIQI